MIYFTYDLNLSILHFISLNGATIFTCVAFSSFPFTVKKYIQINKSV